MEQIGKTTDGKIMVTGVSKLYFEQGLPLSIIFDELEKRNMMPSWNHLYQEFIDNKVGHKRILHLLHEQMHDTYGSKFRDEVINRLRPIA